MRKECHKAKSQETSTSPWTTEVTSPHSVKTERRATRTLGQPSERTHPPKYARGVSARPTETHGEDAIRLRQSCPPANTTPDAEDNFQTIAPANEREASGF